MTPPNFFSLFFLFTAGGRVRFLALTLKKEKKRSKVEGKTRKWSPSSIREFIEEALSHALGSFLIKVLSPWFDLRV